MQKLAANGFLESYSPGWNISRSLIVAIKKKKENCGGEIDSPPRALAFLQFIPSPTLHKSPVMELSMLIPVANLQTGNRCTPNIKTNARIYFCRRSSRTDRSRRRSSGRYRSTATRYRPPRTRTPRPPEMPLEPDVPGALAWAPSSAATCPASRTSSGSSYSFGSRGSSVRPVPCKASSSCLPAAVL